MQTHQASNADPVVNLGRRRQMLHCLTGPVVHQVGHILPQFFIVSKAKTMMILASFETDILNFVHLLRSQLWQAALEQELRLRSNRHAIANLHLATSTGLLLDLSAECSLSVNQNSPAGPGGPDFSLSS